MFVLIFKNTVCQLSEETFPVSPEMEWVDVTAQDPQPEVGWRWNGEEVSPPPPDPPPTKEEMLMNLEKEKQAYIDGHYSPATREWFLGYPQGPLATEAGRAKVISAWSWINQVLVYMFAKAKMINEGASWDELHLDFSQFDGSDPLVTVEELLNAS